LLASVVVALGVSVAVQVTPPSLLLKLERFALGAVISAGVKPAMASVKVNVTVAASPMRSAVSLSEMLLQCLKHGGFVSGAERFDLTDV
jgi:hypothetical protein